MADPQTATLTQLRNIQGKTQKTIAELHAVIAASGLSKTGEQRKLLMEQFKLGYGDANVVALFYGKLIPELQAAPGAAPKPVLTESDPLDAIYAGPKAPLRPLHQSIMAVLQAMGDFEVAPKKSYVSLRRKKQFAMVGPATKDLIEIGINAKDLPSHPRLKVQPPGAMCQATTRVGHIDEVDATLTGWLKQAFDSAA
ncbi:MAG: DUF5655 domain-containing protein [Rhodoferax sp.]|nr:DUF5655 domain-containing protein [Rhodoferax sp.]MCF8209439.1 DUF5655 domain-containing protein [Rhodoferax sp.]